MSCHFRPCRHLTPQIAALGYSCAAKFQHDEALAWPCGSADFCVDVQQDVLNSDQRAGNGFQGLLLRLFRRLGVRRVPVIQWRETVAADAGESRSHEKASFYNEAGIRRYFDQQKVDAEGEQ